MQQDTETMMMSYISFNNCFLFVSWHPEGKKVVKLQPIKMQSDKLASHVLSQWEESRRNKPG